MYNFKAIKPAQGYTLVELMITAAVIAMLAAIAIPSYNGYLIKTLPQLVVYDGCP